MPRLLLDTWEVQSANRTATPILKFLFFKELKPFCRLHLGFERYHLRVAIELSFFLHKRGTDERKPLTALCVTAIEDEIRLVHRAKYALIPVHLNLKREYLFEDEMLKRTSTVLFVFDVWTCVNRLWQDIFHWFVVVLAIAFPGNNCAN